MNNLNSINKKTGFEGRAPKVTISTGPTPGQSVDLLGKHGVKKSRHWMKITGFLLLIVVLMSGTVLAVRANNLSSKIFVGQKTTFIQKVKDLIRGGSDSAPLIGENLGQINILLLGIGGQGHDGPYLSDTIILAQIRPDISEVTLTSIPRDYLVELPEGRGQRKLNSAFAEGYYRNRDWNEAGRWARQAVENISGLEIPYFAVVDFDGFEKAVNELGGLNITIDRTFTDYSFPDGKLGYLAPLTFKAGQEQMNGKRALQFARSRHAAGPEGSDFARSQRQQKVIQAFKSKAIELNVVTDAGKINRLLSVFADHFHTNISPSEMYRMYKIITEKNIQHFLNISLDPQTKLICSKILEESGAYVLAPCPGKTDEDIKKFFANAFVLGRLAEEQSVIWLGTSAKNTSSYAEADKKLKEAGLVVWEVGFGKDSLSQTIVYQVNPKPATTEFIKTNLNATEVSLPPPGVKVDPGKVDVIVILGEGI